MQKMRIGYVPQSLNIEKKTPISVYDMIASYQSRYPVFWKKSKKLYEKIEEHLTVFKAEELIDKQVCGISPRMTRMSVDLPAPFFPITAARVPQWICRFTCCNRREPCFCCACRKTVWHRHGRNGRKTKRR